MIGYDGHGTIPKADGVESFWLYVERVYGRRSLARILCQGLLLTAFSSFPTVVGSVLRGYVYRFFLGGIGKKCFLEKNIRFFNSAKLFLGDRVFVGAGAFFDAGPEASAIEIGTDSHIARNVTMRIHEGKIEIGEKVNIGADSFIYGYGDIRIGDYCLVANQVEIISGTHDYQDVDTPMRFQGRTPSEIVIGEDVWLGTHAVVLGGVTIGKGAIIGAGSVVHRDIPEYGIAVGIPARVIKSRKD